MTHLRSGGSAEAQRAVLQLQRQYGNRYTQRVLQMARQDEEEEELQAQRDDREDEEDEEKEEFRVQRKGAGGDAVAPQVEATINRKRGGGQALDSGTRAQMGTAFAADFSGVRIHTDTEADTLNRALGARAFTTGRDVFFRQGEYNPATTAGQELLAHELTHVAQQSGEQIRGKLTVSQPGDPYEREADEVARRVARKRAQTLFPQRQPMKEKKQRPMGKVDNLFRRKSRGGEAAIDNSIPEGVMDYSSPVMGRELPHLGQGSPKVRTRRAPSATESVGGTAITFAPGVTGEEEKTIAVGEQGGTRRLLTLLPGATRAELGNYEDAHLRPVSTPDFTSLEKLKATYAADAVRCDREAKGEGKTALWGKPSPSIERLWRDRATRYEDRVKLLTRHQYQEETIVEEFNAWVPRANVMFLSMARLEGLQTLLGVSRPEAMATALVSSLEDAQRIAQRVQKDNPGLLDIPVADAKVSTAAQNVTEAATSMSTKWLGFQQVLAGRRSDALKKSGEADEKRLAEIREVIDGFRKIGKTIDLSLSVMKGGKELMGASGVSDLKQKGKEVGKTVAGSVGLPTSAEGILGGFVALVYEDEIKNIEDTLATLKTQAEAHLQIANELNITQRLQEFENAVNRFKSASRELADRMAARREAYLKLGEQIDEAAKSDQKARAEGAAPLRTGERFSTVMTMTAAVREVLAIGRGAAAGFDHPNQIRSELQDIAAERGLSEPEYAPLVSVHSQVTAFHGNVMELERVLGPVDTKAAKVMSALQAAAAAGGGDVGAY